MAFFGRLITTIRTTRKSLEYMKFKTMTIFGLSVVSLVLSVGYMAYSETYAARRRRRTIIEDIRQERNLKKLVEKSG